MCIPRRWTTPTSISNSQRRAEAVFSLFTDLLVLEVCRFYLFTAARWEQVCSRVCLSLAGILTLATYSEEFADFIGQLQ